MARQVLIDTADDMKWLRDVHLPKLPAKYKSAIIVGNEDYPDRIEVYERQDPRVTDVPLVFTADEEGVFRETKKPQAHHATKKKAPAQLQREIDEALGATSITPDKLEYAQRRANATRTPYAISSMGHVMVADAHNKRLMRDELGGVARIVKPRAHASIKSFSAPKPSLTVRQINAIVRAADGRNVYLIRERMGDETVQRVTSARTKGRETEVRSLATGNWIPVLPERGDKLEVR